MQGLISENATCLRKFSTKNSNVNSTDVKQGHLREQCEMGGYLHVDDKDRCSSN